ncbi:MAG: U32 family peptidase [Victivallales bacterium]|nr:U32 family peptidase [Victivallales bacterium]
MTKSSRKHIPELLAPEGDFSSLVTAVKAGCEAVYIGGKSFSMRGAPENFTPAGIRKASDFCHNHGVSLYVTVNTIIYDSEVSSMGRFLQCIAGCVDAVICWDPSVISGCIEYRLPFHISTQASVSNSISAMYYKALGASRVVLARECTLKDITRIAKNVDIGLEVFAHGAMCVSESGRCFLSQDTYGKSGNRGECLQNCRRPYRVICQDGPGDYEVFPGDNHIFSAKDLCTLPFIDKLLATGVSSLKIEGRNRPPEYVDTVIRAYRTAIDAWRDNRLDDSLKARLIEDCRKVFNRDFSAGFYLGRPITDFSTVENNAATQRKSLVGKVINYYPKSGVAHVSLLADKVNDGDEILIIGPTSGLVRTTLSGVRIEEPTADNEPATATFKVPERVRPHDAVYKIIRKKTVSERN